MFFFSRFLNCTNGTKSHKTSHIHCVFRILNVLLSLSPTTSQMCQFYSPSIQLILLIQQYPCLFGVLEYKMSEQLTFVLLSSLDNFVIRYDVKAMTSKSSFSFTSFCFANSLKKANYTRVISQLLFVRELLKNFDIKVLPFFWDESSKF